MKSMPSSVCWLAALVATLFAGLASADLFWQGTGDWNTNNWSATSGGPYNQPWAAGSNAQFETTAGTITVNAATSVGNMTFGVGQTVDGSQTLTLSGTTATVATGLTATISAPLGGDVLTKAGAGSLILSGNNAHTGLTTVSAGVLSIQSNTALGAAASGTTVAAGASLRLQGGITVAGESLSVVGDGIHYADNPGALRNTSGNNTWTGPVAIGSSLTRVASDSGTLLLEGNITLTGSVTNHLVLQGNGNITITGNISGGGSGQTLTRSGVGSGVMTLAGTNTYGG